MIIFDVSYLIWYFLVLTYLESDDEDETTSMSDAVSTSTGMESKTQKSTGKTQTEKGQQSGDDKSVDDRRKHPKFVFRHSADICLEFAISLKQ